MSNMDKTMTEQDTELLIHEAYGRCLNSFICCRNCVHLSEASRRMVADEMSRFMIWAANIGAHLDWSISSSLDHRLRNSERARTSVTLLLRVLRVNIDYGPSFQVLDKHE